MRTSAFDYPLPPELIAQSPAAHRDASRLLVLNRAKGAFSHQGFRELPEFLRPGDVLVLNNSRVIAARLRGTKSASGGAIEMLLLEDNDLNDWWVMLKPAKRVREGTGIRLLEPDGSVSAIRAVVREKNAEGQCRLEFDGTSDILLELPRIGETPIPPYIARETDHCTDGDRERYQTVFAGPPGSVAAPTAGLHFTREMLDLLRGSGVRICFVTLHVGLGTFAPVKTEQLEDHVMHEERFQLCAETARELNEATREGRRVIAAGTTSLRVLECVAAAQSGQWTEQSGRTRLFIRPPFRFKAVDALLTNFHLPRSTLLALVSAFATPGRLGGREIVLAAYAEAVRERYRFFSYGDAMLIL